jgi:hypothetical protein
MCNPQVNRLLTSSVMCYDEGMTQAKHGIIQQFDNQSVNELMLDFRFESI